MTPEQLQEMLDDSPFHQLFDLKIAAVNREGESISIHQRYTPSVERGPDTKQYHGGVIASLIDITGDFALIYLLDFGVRFAEILYAISVAQNAVFSKSCSNSGYTSFSLSCGIST